MICSGVKISPEKSSDRPAWLIRDWVDSRPMMTLAFDCSLARSSSSVVGPLARKSSMTRWMVARALASVSLFRAV